MPDNAAPAIAEAPPLAIAPMPLPMAPAAAPIVLPAVLFPESEIGMPHVPFSVASR